MKWLASSFGLAAALAVVVLIAELWASEQWAVGVLYLLPVFAAAQARRVQTVLIVALLATVFTILSLLVPELPPREQIQTALIHRGVALAAIWGAVWALHAAGQQQQRLQRQQQSLERRARELSDELAAVRTELEHETSQRRHGDAARSRLVNILDRTPDLVSIARADGRLVYLNQAGRQLLGIAADEPVNTMELAACYPPRSERVIHDQVLPTAAREGSWSGELFLQPRDGREVPIAVVVLAHQDAAGEVEYWATIARDITLQNEADMARRESEGRILAIFEAAIDSIITIDEEGKILEFNRAAEKIFRARRDAVIGKEMAELFFPAESRERHRANLARYQISGAGSMLGKRLELEMRRSDDEEFIAQISIQPVSLKGQPVFSVFLQDITKRKQAEEALARQTKELARSNSELAQFAYVASHDLQEPLRAVISHCQLLKKRLEGTLDEITADCLNFAVDGAERMKRLINDMLSYSRVGSQGRRFEMTDVALVVEEVLVNLSVAIEESGAKVHYQELPAVMADSRQLPQLFQNLIGNALKYRADRPPEVHIQAESNQEHWLFTVRDNGIGISPEHAERIFVIFKRLHTREEYSGTGIGLALCKKIVELHGGRIWVESEEGLGSTFCFTWPKKQALPVSS